MQDIVPGPLSRERRLLRRRQRYHLLLAALAFIAGSLAGWFILGWSLIPVHPQVRPPALARPSRFDYIQMVVDAWALEGDNERALGRLQGFDPQELAAVLGELRTARQLSGDKSGLSRVTAFAKAFGVSVEPGLTVLGAGATPTAARAPAATPTPNRIAIAPDVPASVRASIRQWLLGQTAVLVSPDDNPQVLVSTSAQPGSILLSERVYVLVDRFATLRSDVPFAQVQALWQGGATADGARVLLVTADAVDSLSALLGRPGANVKTAAADALVKGLWDDPAALGILPFDRLEPRVVALKLDGQNVLSHDLRPEQYPLVARVYVGGQMALAQKLVLALRQQTPLTNRDPERITTLIMSGTTAIARSAAYKIEQKKDPAYPARLIGPTLAAADITHISNEIPFVDNCQPVLQTMVFCSKPSYMAAFKLAGVDIVGLTGNHLLDYGVPPLLKTIDAYDAAGMRYYGGGRDAADAAKTLFLTDHGNRLAFLGANSFGPASVWATTKQPGAQRYDATVLKQEIADARKKADVVFVELQAEETYDYQPSATNQAQFRGTLANGADVVTGVQAHQPQGFEFSEEGRGLILYGLGNLFFDQMFDLNVRQELIARHTIYRGRLLQTELLTAILEDYVQPRWMTPAERATLLRSVFEASKFQWVPRAQK